MTADLCQHVLSGRHLIYDQAMEAVTGWLAPADEANLMLDHAGQVNVFLVAGLLAPGGFVAPDGTADLAQLRAVLRDRVATVSALRRRVDPVGHRHRWVEASPDLEYHVRLAEPVNGIAGLEDLCAELMIRPLPMDRPLWEMLVAPGAIPGGAAVVFRVHHAVADGMAAAAIMRRLFDPNNAGTVPADDPEARSLDDIAESVGPTMHRLRSGLRRAVVMVHGREVGCTSLLGERSPRRAVAILAGDIDGMRVRLRPMAATVNDALLAASASGFIAALSAAGESIPATLPVSVPVALHRRGAAANQVGVMLVRLPVGEPDPDARLRRIAAQTRDERVEARQQGTLEFMRGPIGARIMDRIGRRQHLVVGFITNVPGPDGVLHLAGSSVDTLFPVAVLAGNVRLGVAAVSYAGRLCCGVHFDADNVHGDVFARAMEEELVRLGG